MSVRAEYNSCYHQFKSHEPTSHHRKSVATRRMSVSEGWNCRPGALFYILVTGFFYFMGMQMSSSM